MKNYKLLFYLFFCFLMLPGIKALAQSNDCCEEFDTYGREGMTQEQWQLQYNQYQKMIADLTAQKTALLSEIDGLNKTLQTRNGELSQKDSEYSSLQKDYDEYGRNLSKAENQCSKKEGKKEDVEKLYNELNKSKLKCHPDFADRTAKLKDCLDKWTLVTDKKPDQKQTQTTGNTYTVVKGDCLYKIAGKKKIYGSSKYWPKLWEANKDDVVSAPPKVAKKITNPNLIYPGQVLKVPALTDDDKTKMKDYSYGSKILKNYKGVIRKKNKKVKSDTDLKKTEKEVKKTDKTADKKKVEKDVKKTDKTADKKKDKK